MDIRYLIQILLLIVFFIGIYYVSLQRGARRYCFTHIPMMQKEHFLYSRFSKLIEPKKMCVFEKYQIWRYIEHRKDSSFIQNL